MEKTSGTFFPNSATTEKVAVPFLLPQTPFGIVVPVSLRI
jgi:hypothetical protein